MQITPLYKLPIPTVIENSEMFEKYVSTNIWEGDLWIDGAWGPKHLIQELISDDPITGFKIPLLIQPINDMDFDTMSESNQRYHVCFPGETWKLLYNFINAVKIIGAKEQKYVLSSYFSTELPEEGKEIYQLVINVNSESTTINIEKGKWIPSFDDSLIIARWN